MTIYGQLDLYDGTEMSEVERNLALDTERVAFGRHETFPLRHGWLTKGFWEFLEYVIDTEEFNFFASDDAVVKLGVGKNMVSSIKFWLIASQMLQQDNKGQLSPTKLGLHLIGRKNKSSAWDPYLEDEATLWLVHWLVSTSPKQATGFFWFFNLFHKANFTQDEMLISLSDFVTENAKQKYAKATIKNDVTTILRMYAQKQLTKKTVVEEVFDSPFIELGLITAGANTKSFVSELSSSTDIPAEIAAFAINELFIARGTGSISLTDIIYSDGKYPALGSTFRLSENACITLLERVINIWGDTFELRETAGNRQVYKVKECESLDILESYYEGGAA